MRVDIQQAFNYGMAQIEQEIIEFIEFYETLDVSNFLEIGTEYGGTFYLFCIHAPNLNKAISIDIPYDTMKITIEERNNRLKTFAENVYPLVLDSHKHETMLEVEQILDGEKLDFLFIDGDHGYEGAKQDFDMYSKLVKKNGWVAFHDVGEHDRAWLGCPRAYDYATIGRKTFMIDAKSAFGGIGVIQM